MAESMLQLGEILLAGLYNTPKSRYLTRKAVATLKYWYMAAENSSSLFKICFFLVFRCSLVVRYALRNSLIPSSVLKMIFLFLELSAFPSPFAWPRRVKKSSGRNFRGAKKLEERNHFWSWYSFGTLIGCFFWGGRKNSPVLWGLFFQPLVQDPIMNQSRWSSLRSCFPGDLWSTLTETHIF